MASVRLSSSTRISVTELTIRKPTIINAGAVAKEGMVVNRGANRVDSRNSRPDTMAVRPVRPPADTPEADSTKVVTVEVPSTAPAEVPMASASREGLMQGNLPFLSSILALVATPMRVPKVSNRSTNKKATITTKKSVRRITFQSTLKHWPKVLPMAVKSKEMIDSGIKE